MVNFNSQDSVHAWLNDNGGIEGLRIAVRTGRLANQKQIQAEAWLDAHDRNLASREASEERALVERNVSAAEASAKAAKKSATWAIWAALSAAVAAIVSVAQFLSQR